MAAEETKLRVFGQKDQQLEQIGEREAGVLREVKVKQAVRLESKRAAGVEEIVLKGLKENDVLELTFDGDIRRWMTVAEIKEEFGITATRGGDPHELELPQRLPIGDTTRGVTSWVLKALRWLDFDPVAETMELATIKADEHIMEEPGLYSFKDGFQKKGKKVSQDDLVGEKPLLIFLHGTFSSTQGSFGKLKKSVWETLSQQYGERIYGLEHHTLSVSPIQNALDLVKILPKGARLHLVSHSRGGLIGELLCRSGIHEGEDPFDQLDFNLGHTKEIQELLEQLSAELKHKEIKINRFVRVAGAAGGTTLASGRLDRWLEVMVNVIGKVTGASATVAYGVITDLLLDLKKQSANAEAMPGVACLVPTSPMVRMLNRSDIELDADLSVIAGDTQGDEILKRVAIFFTDLFFFEDHDLVVHTRSMYGGAKRVEEARYFFHKGADINHFKYFSNSKTADHIQAALTQDLDNLIGQEQFWPISAALRTDAAPEREITKRSYQKRSGIPQPVVFVLPGIMGSHLSERGNRIWLDVPDLAIGRFANLNITNPDIEPQAPMASSYARLIDYLSSTHEVIPFPYDWRKSILESAERLGTEVAQKLKETDQPIRIVAHSMGGLVTRAMFALCNDVWEDFAEREGARFLLLGTPNKGAYAIPRLMMAKERTLQYMALLDLRHSKKELLDWIVQFPGVLELLPFDDEQWDYFSVDVWEELLNMTGDNLALPTADDLKNAKKFSGVLDRSPIDSQKMAYIAGCAPNTPCGIEIMDSDGNLDLHFIGTDEGDGRVPWSTGLLPEVPTWYMGAAHGDLANHEPGFPAIYELLANGETQQLPMTPQRVSRSGQRQYRLKDDQPEVFPVEMDLAQAAMGATPTRLETPKEEPVRVSVAHGNLAFCEYAVAVGHYEGDALVSAEKALNYHLKGRLATHHELGIYPGDLGSALVILTPENKPGGAIVVGLGKVGELSPKKLTNTFVNALTKYAVQCLEDHSNESQLEIPFTSLLVGTGEGGLSIENSMAAILESVFLVNKSLAQLPAAKNARIVDLQFIELFKDRAIQATHALAKYPDKDRFQIEKQLQNLKGGLHRVAFDESPGWWNRMQIRKGKEHSLVFTLPTQRARAEESELEMQWGNIDRIIQQAVNNPNWNWRMASTMFELLLPNRVKAFVSDLSNVVLVVDQTSARYPWELIYDRRVGDENPMVLKVGLIRQLTTSVFRTQVMDVSNQNVMIIGNPANTPSDFVDLPGARQEAQIVAGMFKRHDFNVQAQIETDTVAIMNTLFSDDYRILHLAGHGVFEHPLTEDVDKDGEVDQVTGMVLGGGVYLTATEVNQMMQVPELVFINCCFLGKIGPDDDDKEDKLKAMHFPRHEFAASLSQKLIEMGVKAVVAAGWAVDDAAAITFAESFYQDMLSGGSFGEAVTRARAETYEFHGDRTNTWGAYQAYGDPAYKIVKTTSSRGGQNEQIFVDLEEALVEIDNLTEDAKTTSVQSLGYLRKKLNRLLKNIERSNKSWLDDATLNEKLGEAFGETDQFEQAVLHYEAALAYDKNRTSIKMTEQLANLRVRSAIEVARRGEHDLALKNIARSIKQIKKLNKAFEDSSERLSMIGSAHKRQAQISQGEARQRSLEKMGVSYREAWEISEDDAYPLGNWLTAQGILYWIGAEPRKFREAETYLTKLEKLAKQQKANDPHNFWAANGEVDALLARYILTGSFINKNAKEAPDNDPENMDLAELYLDTWRRYGTARQLGSIGDHLSFLAKMFEPDDSTFEHDSKARKKQRDAFFKKIYSASLAVNEALLD